jgi:hypothetical protein
MNYVQLRIGSAYTVHSPKDKQCSMYKYMYIGIGTNIPSPFFKLNLIHSTQSRYQVQPIVMTLCCQQLYIGIGNIFLRHFFEFN